MNGIAGMRPDGRGGWAIPPGMVTDDRGQWYTVTAGSVAGLPNTVTLGTLVTPDHMCPDLLTHRQIGAADNLRGRVVRAFFWIMRAWPPR